MGRAVPSPHTCQLHIKLIKNPYNLTLLDQINQLSSINKAHIMKNLHFLHHSSSSGGILKVDSLSGG